MNDETNRRLERLERSQRRLKGALVLALGMVVIMSTAGFRRDDEEMPVLNASSVAILNQDGEKRVWIGIREGHGRIRLYDESGEPFWCTPEPEVPSPVGRAADVPDALTQEQISKMSLKEVQIALERVASARQHGLQDQETNQRLKEEFRMLLQRLRELRSGG